MKRERLLALTIAVLGSTAPVTAFAHDGHGIFSAHSIMHYLAEPLHVGPLVIVVIAIAGWAIWRRKKAI